MQNNNNIGNNSINLYTYTTYINNINNNNNNNINNNFNENTDEAMDVVEPSESSSSQSSPLVFGAEHDIYFGEWIKPFITLCFGHNLKNTKKERQEVVEDAADSLFSIMGFNTNSYEDAVETKLNDLVSTYEVLYFLGCNNPPIEDEIKNSRFNQRALTIINTPFMQNLIKNPPQLTPENNQKRTYIQKGFIPALLKDKKITVFDNNAIDLSIEEWLINYLELCLPSSDIDKKQVIYSEFETTEKTAQTLKLLKERIKISRKISAIYKKFCKKALLSGPNTYYMDILLRELKKIQMVLPVGHTEHFTLTMHISINPPDACLERLTAKMLKRITKHMFKFKSEKWHLFLDNLISELNIIKITVENSILTEEDVSEEDV